jgi:hypothetical protein
MTGGSICGRYIRAFDKGQNDRFVSLKAENATHVQLSWFQVEGSKVSSKAGLCFTSATTAIAVLTFIVPPAVTTNPVSQNVYAGQKVTFTAGATGTPTPTVQWQVDPGLGYFFNITGPGATSTTYSFTATQAESGYQYQAVFSNSSGVPAITTAATLVVATAPVVTLNPTNQSGGAGQTVSFTAAATGNPLPTVVWQASANGAANSFVALPAADSTLNSLDPLFGFNESTLTLAADSGYRYVQAVFTNSDGTTTESASSTIAVLTLIPPPTLTRNPANETVVSGGTATFTANATGTPTVQWQESVDGGTTFTDIVVATSNTLSFGTDPTLNGVQVRAVFTNVGGTTISGVATLNVLYAPIIAANPASTAVDFATNASTGGPATFTAAANANPTATVQWQVSTNGGATFSNIAGATSTTLTLPTTTVAENGNQYRAVFKNSVGSTVSAAATLTTYYLIVTEVPTFTTVNGVYGQIATAIGNPAPSSVEQVSTNGGATYTDLPASEYTVTVVGNQISLFFPYSYEVFGDLYRILWTN